jgi:Phospholipid methyltransferase
MLGLVLTRVRLLKKRGIEAMHFGKIDKTDFFIPLFALFYFYMVLAAAFGRPTVSRQEFFTSEAVAWVGVFSCVVGLSFLVWSLISFGRNFRLGIDTDHPDKLVTTGIFAFSRNPIYGGMAVPPPGPARRGVLEEALRRGIHELLPAGQKVSLRVGMKIRLGRRSVSVDAPHSRGRGEAVLSEAQSGDRLGGGIYARAQPLFRASASGAAGLSPTISTTRTAFS